uniref:Uncharacterized protein n=1 Tax=Tanacetum cinerariifolium TaxID=118510 RepID=A0A699GWZ4_TANCI|nr:hypothetical protein [Tanacetum cinerariifolium]
MLPKCHDPIMTMVKPVMKLAFDPRNSPLYKIVLTTVVVGGYQKMKTYCSKIGRWNVCTDRYAFKKFLYFEWGIYWNRAIHWLDSAIQPVHFMLDIKNEHLVLSNVQLPSPVDKKEPWECSLFESHGSLLLGGDVPLFVLLYWETLKKIHLW